MDIAFYRSSIEPVALALCLFASFQLYKTYKHYSAILISVGFLIAIITHISINYCIGIALLTDLLSNNPYLCSPVIPYIKGFGYFLVGLGLLKFNEYLKSS